MRGDAAALVVLAAVAAVWAPGRGHAAPPAPAAPGSTIAAPPIPEPDSYHPPPYEGAVPLTLTGARVIDRAEALRLHGQGAVFVDVLPRTRRPPGLPPGTLWRVPAHQTIPGAIWLPSAGFERLTQREQKQMRAALTTATGGNTARALVVFCRPDCWLSWNAARRAVAMGYRAVHWFPEGTPGWVAAGGDLAVAAAPDDGD